MEKKYIESCSLIVTEKCNLDCTYCFEKGKHNGPHMSKEVVRNTIEYLIEGAKRNKSKQIGITFFGGEPTLNIPGMTEVLTYGKKRTSEEGLSMNLNIITNAVFFNQELEDFYNLWRNLFGRISVQISMDGVPEIQDKNRIDIVGKGSSARVEEAIKGYKKMYEGWGESFSDGRIHVHSVLTKLSLPRMWDSFMYFQDLGFSKIWFMPLHEEDWSEDDLELFKEQSNKISKYIYNKVMETNDAKYYNMYSSLSKCKVAPSPKTCALGTRYATVTPSGDLHPCHNLYFNTDKFKFGNVLDGIGDGGLDKRQYFFDLNRNSIVGDIPCKSCSNNNCYTCVAANYTNNGDFQIGFPKYCKLSRAEEEIRIDLRTKLENAGKLKKVLTKSKYEVNLNVSNNSKTNNSCNSSSTKKSTDRNMQKDLDVINNKLNALLQLNKNLIALIIDSKEDNKSEK